MADYDVQALGLANPPPSAPATTYYPGVSVRNNGVHPANVTGYIRQYDRDTGLLIATFQVARVNLQPEATENVSSPTPLVWTPADIGRKFLFQGYATTDRDSVPSNNYFGPVEVEVTGATPPPPVIEAHHNQHENGGSDELNLDGLAGKLAEHQDPTEHASDHEDGGTDQLAVDGLNGELADPQTPKAHASTHSVGGSDPVSGITPAEHGNEAHNPEMATVATLQAHKEDNTAHAVATNLEQTANKDQSSGYAGLGADALVKESSATFDTPHARATVATEYGRNTQNEILDHEWPAGEVVVGSAIIAHILAAYSASNAGTPELVVFATIGAHAELELGRLSFNNIEQEFPDFSYIDCTFRLVPYVSGSHLVCLYGIGYAAQQDFSPKLAALASASASFTEDESLRLRIELWVPDVADAHAFISDADFQHRRGRTLTT